ncbi:hypothetical protein ACIPQH_25340 [Streptomyces rubiginosohelvolus]|uniref:hypothetical protein n=1 Tax=Streptomyces rubiginosohelvolus TaxID=67362 RepID=UPI0037F46B6E
MSHDYVAILVSVDAAVLLVATLQYGAMLRSFVASGEARIKERQDRAAQLIEARRAGVQPSNDDLLALRPEPRIQWWPPRKLVASRLARYSLGTLGYVSLTSMLSSSLLSIIRWAGTAEPGPDPQLARSAFNITALAVLALLAEVLAVGIFTALRSREAVRGRLRKQYGDQEVDALRALFEAAQSDPGNAASTPSSPAAPAPPPSA